MTIWSISPLSVKHKYDYFTIIVRLFYITFALLWANALLISPYRLNVQRSFICRTHHSRGDLNGCNKIRYLGFCKKCQVVHSIGISLEAKKFCQEVADTIESTRRIDYDVPKRESDPSLGESALRSLSEDIGKMFGVLVGIDNNNNTVYFKAFSGQIAGRWTVEGWAPPLPSINHESPHYQREQKIIQTLGSKIRRWKELEPITSERIRTARSEQKQRSRSLLKAMWNSAKVYNFIGDERTLADIWTDASEKGNPPSGFGDCCAPKLLNFAAREGVQPVALAEMWLGAAPPGGGKLHGTFYPSCKEKCWHILGFSLCGCQKGLQ